MLLLPKFLRAEEDDNVEEGLEKVEEECPLRQATLTALARI